jgi:diaphanous 1
MPAPYQIAILELNEAILDAETVEQMVPNCPEQMDVDMVNSYEGDPKLLGKAELYFREVGVIPRLRLRLQTFHFKMVYEEKAKELAHGIAALKLAASTITESLVFKKLLEVVLIFGNFLNQGSFRGNAQGVKITVLTELKDVKAHAAQVSQSIS